MVHDVFISYSFRDKHVTDAVCNALESSRIKCWIAPRDIVPGKEWGEELVETVGKFVMSEVPSTEDKSNLSTGRDRQKQGIRVKYKKRLLQAVSICAMNRTGRIQLV